MTDHAPEQARVIPLRQATAARVHEAREPLWRHLVGDVLRSERLAQKRTLKDVADAARISMPYLSEVERGRKEASSEVLAAAAQALGLGLADVLSLAGGELAARFARAGGSRSRSRGSDGRTGADRTTPDRMTANRMTADRTEEAGTASSGRAAVTGDEDAGVTSVSQMSTRRTGTRAAVRQGAVRLAA